MTEAPRQGPRAFLEDLKLAPNLMCVYRTIGILVAVAIFYMGHPYLSVAIGITAGATDYLDGWLARRMGVVSEFGALLDQISDLIFAFVCLIVAYDHGLWPLYILVAWGFRDITTLALRANAAQAGFTLPSSFLGKLASNFMFYSFIVMVFDFAKPFGLEHPASAIIHWIGLLGIHVGIILQYVAMSTYVRSYMQRYESQIVLPGRSG